MVTTDTQVYAAREEVAVNMTLKDVNGRPLKGDFSMSVVTSSTILEGNDNVSNIKSWLLLNSDLGGTVANPDYFFEDNSKSRKHLLDVLMLTHGWRRFVWKDFLNTKVTRMQAFSPEKGIMINGRTTAFKNRYQPKRTLTTLNIYKDGIYQEKKRTNAQGEFSFGPFSFQDSITATIEAVDPEAKKIDDFAIYPNPPSPKIAIKNKTRRKINRRTIAYPDEYLDKAYLKKVTDFKYDPKVTVLKEVVVTEKKKTKKELFDEEINSLASYGNPSNRVFPDSIFGLEYGSALDVLRTVAGVQVMGAYPNQEIIIRRSTRGSVNLFGNQADSSGIQSNRGPSGPLILLDRLPVSISSVQQIPAHEIMFVDVFKGPDAAIYGSRGAHGVVSFHTNIGLRSTLELKKVPGIVDLKVPGFYKTREFYTPNYSQRKPEHKKPDYRTTLHWKPNISLDKEGKSSVHFYTGDSTGDYRIKVEGVTADGRPVNSTHSFSVNLSE